MPQDAVKGQAVTAPPIVPDQQLPPADAPPRHRSRSLRLLVWLLILLAFGALFWFVLFRKQKQTPTADGRAAAVTGPVTSTIATAEKGSIGVYLDTIGTVTPVYTVTVTSQVTGLISEVRYTEGQIVHRGDPLIDVDPRPFQAQLLQAQGALERDINVLAQARMDLERYQKAWEGNGIARQLLEDQQKIVLQAEGTVKLDQGMVKYAQVQLSFCHITAPISGRVGLRLVDPGNVVQADSTTPLVVITQLQPITVVFTIAADSIGEVAEEMRKGKILQVTAYDRTNQSKIASGKLQTIDNQIDTTTGTLKLRALFQNNDNKLFPNLFVNTKLLVKTLHGVTLVPSAAIQQNGNTSFVYVIHNHIAHLCNIKPLASDSGKTAVEGVNPGDVVATSSFERLENGVKIVVAQTPPPSSTPESNSP